MTVVSFFDIHKSYGETIALAGVTFDVREGDVFGLLGPNGAGKTTLIRILLDIIRPNSGQVSLFGEALTKDHMDRVGYLPEERGLYVKQKVSAVMTYFGTLKGLSRREAKERTAQWLERIGLPEVAEWRVNRLSKGMSQKVQIAATLFTEPRLCLLDEPFSGLDPVNVRLVKDLIAERKSRGLTTILSTHQMNLVEEVCDSVAFIDRGLLREHGTVQEVRQRHSQPEVRVTVQSPLPELRGVTSRIKEGEKTWRISLADGVAPSELLKRIVAEDVAVERFETLLAPMEDVFLRIVKGRG